MTFRTYGLFLALVVLSAAAPGLHAWRRQSDVKVQVYGRDQGDLLGTFTEVHKTSGGIGNVSVEVTLAELGTFSRNCAVGEDRVELEGLWAGGEQAGAIRCVFLPAGHVADLDEAQASLALAERAFLESSRLARAEAQAGDAPSSGVLAERNRTRWEEREAKIEEREAAALALVSAALGSPTHVSEPAKDGGPLSCAVSADASSGLVPAVLSSADTWAAGEGGGSFLDAITGPNERAGAIRRAEVTLRLPRPDEAMDGLAVASFWPRAAPSSEEVSVTVEGSGFHPGLVCSYGEGPGGSAAVASESRASCALPALPEGAEDGSRSATAVVLSYGGPTSDVCGSGTFEVERYPEVEVLEARAHEAGGEGELEIVLNVGEMWAGRIAASSALVPSCRLRGEESGLESVDMAAAAVNKEEGTVVCTTAGGSVAGGNYEIGLSLNAEHYSYSGHVVTLGFPSLVLGGVDFDGEMGDLVVEVILRGVRGEMEVSAYLNLTLVTLGSDEEKRTTTVALLAPFSVPGEEAGTTVRISVPDEMIPTLQSDLELSIVQPRGANVPEANGTMTLWNQSAVSGFALRAQSVLRYRESWAATLEVELPRRIQFRDGELRARTSGGTAIPAYHYQPTMVRTELRRGKGSDDLHRGLRLQVPILWDHISRQDFVTIGLEITYALENGEAATIFVEDACLAWGLQEGEESCPTGTIVPGNATKAKAWDYGKLKFRVLASSPLHEGGKGEELHLHPPHNPTLTKFEALTLEREVLICNAEGGPPLGLEVYVSLVGGERVEAARTPGGGFAGAVALSHGPNEIEVAFRDRESNMTRAYTVEVHRALPSEYIRGMRVVTERGGAATLCAHNQTETYPLCVPGSRLFARVGASRECWLDVDSNATLSGPFIARRNVSTAVVPGHISYELSGALREGQHTFTMGSDAMLNSRQRIAITLDWEVHEEKEEVVVVQHRNRHANALGAQLGLAFPHCKVCPAGHFSNEVDANLCQPCGEGYHSGGAGSSRCEACAPGHFAAGFANSRCKPCLRGLYMPLLGGKGCLECPENATTHVAGSAHCVLVVRKFDWLPTIVVEFSVTLNSTEDMSEIGATKLGVRDMPAERALEVLVREDVAEGFSSDQYRVSVVDVMVQVSELGGGLVRAKVNVTLSPNITLRTSEREAAEAMKQLGDLSADKGVLMLADNPDQFFGRTLEAINGTSSVDRIMQRETPRMGPGGRSVLEMHWILSASALGMLSCVLLATRARRRMRGRPSRRKKEERAGQGVV